MIGEFDQKPNFHPRLGKLGYIKAEWGPKRKKKRGSQEPRVVLHSFYVQIQPINLICSFNWKV